jgi:hypothetical protein
MNVGFTAAYQAKSALKFSRFDTPNSIAIRSNGAHGYQV